MPIRTPCSSAWLDQRPPDLEEPRPVGVDRLRRVAADERVDDPDAQLGRGVDDLAQVRDGHAPTRPGRPTAGSGSSPGPRSPRRCGPTGRGRRSIASGDSRSRRGASRPHSAARPCRAASTSARRSRTPASAAKPSTSSAEYSGRIAVTNPSFMAVSSSTHCTSVRCTLARSPRRAGPRGPRRRRSGNRAARTPPAAIQP